MLGGGQDLYCYEEELRAGGFTPVAGADEAGRGACAGPLVAGAVILPPGLRLAGLNDSKLMTAKARDRVYDEILAGAVAWGVAVIPAAAVDRHGVQQANHAAMRQAVAALGTRPRLVLFDGFNIPGVPERSVALVKGDRLAACIAAASVVAKVARDRIMLELDQAHPRYGFGAHKGYATAIHQAALDSWGPCPEHRMSYANVSPRGNKPSPGAQSTAERFVGQNGEGSARCVQGDLLGAGANAEAGS